MKFTLDSDISLTNDIANRYFKLTRDKPSVN